MTAAYGARGFKPNDSDLVTADALDRLAADVASIKAKVDAVSPEDVKHFVDSEKAWGALVTEQRDAAIRERDEWREEARLAVINRDEARAEVERLRAEVERLRMQLAVCGVLADCNTTDSLERNRRVHLDYDCAAVQSVIRAVGREIALRAEVEELKAMLKEQQPPAAPQPAAPPAVWLTERERHVLSSMLSERPVDSSLHWRDDVLPVFRSILARAGSPPVVEVPATCPSAYGFDSPFSNGQYRAGYREACLVHRAAIRAVGGQWKEVGRE